MKVAASGVAGQECLRESLPARACLVVLEVELPFADGYLFRLAQARDPDLADIPVVVVYRRLDPTFRANLATDYLQRPFELHQLAAVVARWCAAARKNPDGSPSP
ncbi:MAG: hypothetical protein HY906_14855 [Deltaproteobacteria bacterium]|nr:hypothetical protein [Deltaproteobacteria bacterium]